MKKATTTLWMLGLIQAVGVGLVLWGWTTLMTNMNKLVAETPEPTLPAFLVIPITFIITAVLSAGAVLGYPIYLALNKHWPKALWLVGWTLLWLVALAAILIYLY